MPHNARRILLLLAMAGPVLALAAAARAQQPGAPMREIVYALANNLYSVPAFVALENGYWAKLGVNVKLKLVTSGREVTEAMQTGEAQLGGISFSTTTPSARASGNLVKGVVPYSNAAEYVAKAGGRAILGRKDRGIRPDDPRSLLGKKIANLAGSSNDVMLREILRRNGIAASQVELVNVPVPNMPITLSQGLADASSPWEPYVSQGIRELGDNAVIVTRSPVGVIGDVVGIGVSDKFIAGNAEALKLLALGMAEATHFVRTRPAEAAKIATYYLDGLNEADAAEGIRHMDWDPRISVCTEEGMVRSGNDMAKAGLIKIDRPFTVADLADDRFVAATVAAHPELFADLPALPKSLAECKGPLP